MTWRIFELKLKYFQCLLKKHNVCMFLVLVLERVCEIWHILRIFFCNYIIYYFSFMNSLWFLNPASRIKMVSDSQIGETCQRNYWLNILARIVSTLEGPISAPFKNQCFMSQWWLIETLPSITARRVDWNMIPSCPSHTNIYLNTYHISIKCIVNHKKLPCLG